MRDTQAWRRIRIATMYVGYAALYAEILIHQAVAPGLRGPRRRWDWRSV